MFRDDGKKMTLLHDFLGYDNYVKDLLFIIGKNNYLLSLGINTNKKFHVAIFSILTSKLLGN